MHLRQLDYNLKAVSEKPTASDMSILADPDYAGPDVAADELIVRRMLLCHDQYDRTCERFPVEYLKRFAETQPGKAVLIGHDTQREPVGRFFKARVSRIDEQSFPVLVTRERKAAEQVSGFEEKAARVSYLDTGFYYPASEKQLDDKIRTGVYRSVSIGFRYDDVLCDLCRKSYLSDCPHLVGRWDDGKLTTLTYGGDAEKAESLEGSIVYLGAQPQARIVKQVAADMARRGAVDPEALAYVDLYGEVDLVTLKWAEHLARKHGHQQKTWAFPALEAKAIDPEPPAAQEQDDMDEFLKRLIKIFGLADTATADEAISAAEKAKNTAADIETLSEKVAKATDDLKATADKAAAREPLAKIGETAMSDLSKAYLDHCLKLEQSETEAKAVAELFVGKGDYAGLRKLVDDKFAEVCKRYPAGISGDPNAGVEERDEKPKGRPQDHQLF